MIWNENDEAEGKNYNYKIEYNQFMEPKGYRCILKTEEYNSPWLQIGPWCIDIQDAMEQGNIHNERLIENDRYNILQQKQSS